MEQDTVKYDSIENRALPKWLTDQRDGLNRYQPQAMVMKEDKTLDVSLIVTGVTILLVLSVFTIYILRKHRRNSK